MEKFVSPLTGDKLTEGEAHLFNDSYTSKTSAEHDSGCYICRDPDFAQMGLPLCRTCDQCSKRGEPKRPGHVPADDDTCTICGTSEYETPEFAEWEAKQPKAKEEFCQGCGVDWVAPGERACDDCLRDLER